MCGRFTQTAKPEQVETEFHVKISQTDLFKPRYNIAPSQIVAVVLERDGERRVDGLKWGLIPHWSRDASFAAKLINARAESLAEKPSFRDSFRKRRCIIPASGFYEWEKLADGKKQPHYFYLNDRKVFGFAGLWEEWLDRSSGELVETFTVITTRANQILESIHDRMPVILKTEDYAEWLDQKQTNPAQLQKLLVPYPAAEMDSHVVSRAVNSPANDSEELTDEIVS